jgi:hypothetical protein
LRQLTRVQLRKRLEAPNGGDRVRRQPG